MPACYIQFAKQLKGWRLNLNRQLAGFDERFNYVSVTDPLASTRPKQPIGNFRGEYRGSGNAFRQGSRCGSICKVIHFIFKKPR